MLIDIRTKWTGQKVNYSQLKRISELQDKSEEIIQNAAVREKEVEIKKERLRDMEGRMRKTN